MASPMTVEQAKASVRRLEEICAIRPTVANLINLANCYFILGDLEAALPIIETAFQKDPHNIIVAVNMGIMWRDFGNHEGADKIFEMAYKELDPDDQLAKLGYSESLLRRGRWEEAWPIYNSCRASKEEVAVEAGIPLHVKEWDGKKTVRKLAVIDEGGIGDSITYSRYLHKLTELGIDWVYLPFPELRGFYERASWIGQRRLVTTGVNMNVSHWTTTQSLPGNLNSTPSTVPGYPEPLKALSEFVRKHKMGQMKTKPVLGLVWSGAELRNGGRKIHSMTEGQAMRLVCKTDHLVDWVNLQHDVIRMPDPVINRKFSSWEELAGLIVNMDAVVSVETGPMCMAHALGKELLIVLSANSDWKFLESGESPFYPGARIFRNSGVGGGIEKAIDQTIEHILNQYDEKKRIKLVG